MQRFTNGNTLIGYGFVGKIAEATQAQQTSWEATVLSGGQPMLFYRALKLPSLYRYERR